MKDIKVEICTKTKYLTSNFIKGLSKNENGNGLKYYYLGIPFQLEGGRAEPRTCFSPSFFFSILDKENINVSFILAIWISRNILGCYTYIK